MWRALPGVVFFVIIAVLLYFTNMKEQQPLLSKAAPQFYTEEMVGYDSIPPVESVIHNGYVLVNFFASWCTPCLAEHPYLNQLAREYELTIVGVAWRDAEKNIVAMLEEHGNPYTHVGRDVMSKTAQSYGVQGLPESFLINPEGHIVVAHRGPLLPRDIKQKILPYIDEYHQQGAR